MPDYSFAQPVTFVAAAAGCALILYLVNRVYSTGGLAIPSALIVFGTAKGVAAAVASIHRRIDDAVDAMKDAFAKGKARMDAIEDRAAHAWESLTDLRESLAKQAAEIATLKMQLTDMPLPAPVPSHRPGGPAVEAAVQGHIIDKLDELTKQQADLSDLVMRLKDGHNGLADAINQHRADVDARLDEHDMELFGEPAEDDGSPLPPTIDDVVAELQKLAGVVAAIKGTSERQGQQLGKAIDRLHARIVKHEQTAALPVPHSS